MFLIKGIEVESFTHNNAKEYKFNPYNKRKYQVWFTEGVPISLGPWKIVGLPGLVLRALDSEGQYVFDCIGISNKQSLIDLPKGQYTESTRNEVKQLSMRGFIKTQEVSSRLYLGRM